jgi:hypothetical protein
MSAPPGRRSRPTQGPAPRSSGGDAASVRDTADATRHLRVWRPGCPCGCGDRDECLAGQPIPGPGFCPCATLGIEILRRRSALRWHLAGHPADGVGSAA